MDTPALGTTTATPMVEQLQAVTQKAAPATAQAEQVATIQAQDNSSATPKAQSPAAVTSGAAGGNNVSLSDFLAKAGFRPGTRVDMDGPVWYNGTGKITTLTADTLKLNITGKIGNGTITLDRKSGDTFTATVSLDGKTSTMTMKATQKGNKLDLVDVYNKENALHFTISGGTLNLNPDGLGIPGSVDITKL